MSSLDARWDRYAWCVAAEKRLERVEAVIKFWEDIGEAAPAGIIAERDYAERCDNACHAVWMRQHDLTYHKIPK